METSITSARSLGEAAGCRASDFGGVVGGRLAGTGVGVSLGSRFGIATWLGFGMDTVEGGGGEFFVLVVGVGETGVRTVGADRGSETGVFGDSGLEDMGGVGGTIGTGVLENFDSDGIGGTEVAIDAVGRIVVEDVAHPATQNIITNTSKEMCSGHRINRFYQNRCNEAAHER